jgi:drug/metabolite transporter (DMT)-like permease
MAMCDKIVARKWLPVIGLAILSLIWGYNWVVVKQALAFSGPFTFGMIRALIAGAGLFLITAGLKRPLSPGSFWGAVLLGLLQTTGFFGFSTWALVAGGAGKTAVLVYTMPFWLLVLAAPLFGEKMHRWQWIAVGIAFAGLICLFHPWQQQAGLFSSFLAMLAGFSWALAGAWNKYLRSMVQVDLFALNAWQLVIGALPLLLIALLLEPEPIVWTPFFIGAVVYNAVFATAVAWSLWFFALQEMPAGIAGLGTLATPALGVLCAWLVLEEVPIFWEITGMILIFSGLAILSGTGLRVMKKRYQA